MRKKYIGLLLSLVLAFSLASSALATEPVSLSNFQRNSTYTSGQFVDVKAREWYESGVKDAYELGLVKGTSDTTFSPTGSISIAETIALACRVHSIFNTGSADFVQDDVWYQVYVDYATAHGMIAANQFGTYTAKATRAEFAAIMAKALPNNALAPINTIENGAIPDVPMSEKYSAEIYSLYRAGVLTGNDSKGTYTPKEDISRGAVAAIVSRMADTSLRKSLTLSLVCEHKWDYGYVSKEATCEKDGEKTYTCIKCGKTTSIVTPALGHDYVNGKCKRCGVSKNEGWAVRIRINNSDTTFDHSKTVTAKKPVYVRVDIISGPDTGAVDLILELMTVDRGNIDTQVYDMYGGSKGGMWTKTLHPEKVNIYASETLTAIVYNAATNEEIAREAVTLTPNR